MAAGTQNIGEYFVLTMGICQITDYLSGRDETLISVTFLCYQKAVLL